MYKVRCPPVGRRQNPHYRFLHRNRLLLVLPADVDSDVQDAVQPSDETPAILNAALRAFLVGVDFLEPDRQIPSLVTRQGGEQTQWAWLNGEFRTLPWTLQGTEATQSPPDSLEGDVSEPEAGLPNSSAEKT